MSKNNTDQAKDFLQKTIRSMPPDFALREVRFHLQQAVKKLEQVEQKRRASQPKPPTQYEQWQERLRNGLQNSNSPAGTLAIIDNMLSEEYAKLDEILERKKKRSSGQIESDEDDTLLG